MVGADSPSLTELYSQVNNFLKISADYIKTCSIKDPAFINCSTESIQILFTKLATGKYLWQKKNHQQFAIRNITSNDPLGIEGLDNLQIDPMKLNKIKIFSGDGPVSINSSLSKAVVTGFANTVVIESEYVWSFLFIFIHFFMHKKNNQWPIWMPECFSNYVSLVTPYNHRFVCALNDKQQCNFTTAKPQINLSSIVSLIHSHTICIFQC